MCVLSGRSGCCNLQHLFSNPNHPHAEECSSTCRKVSKPRRLRSLLQESTKCESSRNASCKQECSSPTFLETCTHTPRPRLKSCSNSSGSVSRPYSRCRSQDFCRRLGSWQVGFVWVAHQYTKVAQQESAQRRVQFFHILDYILVPPDKCST